jgi:hypothetical protein
MSRRKDRQLPPTSPAAAAAAERIATIIDAAEQAAAAVVDNADATARHYLEQVQVEAEQVVADRLAGLVELTDSLVAQAEAIRQQSQYLLDSLERAGWQIGLNGEVAASSRPIPGPDRPGAESGSAAARSHLSAVAPAPEPTESGDAASGSAAGARLLATQMAVSGSSREEIESRLRSAFEIEDTGSILDAILGPEE